MIRNILRTARAAGLVGLPICALVFAAPALAQRGPAGQQPNPRVDQIFAHLDRQDSPGCALAVSRSGNIIYRRGYGIADLDHNIPITSTTVFHAASLAKQFTAMSIMLLVGQGRLSLDDNVRTHLHDVPGFNNRHITIRQLLQHVSGIRDQWVLATMAGWRLSDDTVTRDDVLGWVRRMKDLNFDPGEQWSYSNTNYTLAGEIVEKLSGQSLADFAHDKIFRPLGMTQTTITPLHGQIVKNRAYGYRGIRDPFDQPPLVLRMPNYDLTGPTNLLTTVEDLMRWQHNFDTRTVGSAAALTQMQTPAVLSDHSTVPYGLGLMISTYRGLNVVEHDGRDAGYRAHLMRFPDQHFAIAVLCNLALPDSNLPGALARKVANVFLEDQLGPADPLPRAASHPASFAATNLGQFEGRYHSDEIDATYEVKLNGSSLEIRRPKYPPTVLTPVSANNFTMQRFSIVLPSANVKFVRNGQQHVTAISIDDASPSPGNRLRNFTFEKVNAPP